MAIRPVTITSTILTSLKTTLNASSTIKVIAPALFAFYIAYQAQQCIKVSTDLKDLTIDRLQSLDEVIDAVINLLKDQFAKGALQLNTDFENLYQQLATALTAYVNTESLNFASLTNQWLEGQEHFINEAISILNDAIANPPFNRTITLSNITLPRTEQQLISMQPLDFSNSGILTLAFQTPLFRTLIPAVLAGYKMTRITILALSTMSLPFIGMSLVELGALKPFKDLKINFKNPALKTFFEKTAFLRRSDVYLPLSAGLLCYLLAHVAKNMHEEAFAEIDSSLSNFDERSIEFVENLNESLGSYFSQLSQNRISYAEGIDSSISEAFQNFQLGIAHSTNSSCTSWFNAIGGQLTEEMQQISPYNNPPSLDLHCASANWTQVVCTAFTTTFNLIKPINITAYLPIGFSLKQAITPSVTIVSESIKSGLESVTFVGAAFLTYSGIRAVTNFVRTKFSSQTEDQ